MKDELFFSAPIDPAEEGRALALQVITRLLIWMSEAQSIEERGMRATVALYCIRPDLISEASLEQIGEITGRSKQAVHDVAVSFREATEM